MEIQFKERGAEESGGKRRKTTRVPNRDELFTLPIGFMDPIDRFLSYFKSDAILREAKTISRNFSIFQLQFELRTIEKRARSKFYFIAIPNDRSLAIAKLFF